MIQMGAERDRRTVRVGFVGLGWIGRMRMGALLDGGAAEAVGVCDPCEEACAAALGEAAGARRATSLEELLEMGVDGVAIATPNALHESQAVAALEAGASVFCQKPLAPRAAGARRVIDAARANDRLLAVDWSYRHLRGVRRIVELIRRGELGRVVAVDATFHNAYGPEGAWFYDRLAAGGGCLVDLGVHLLDLAMEVLPGERLRVDQSDVFAKGRSLSSDPDSPAEDFVWATLRSDRGAAVRAACSWRGHTGADCAIELRVHGSRGAASVRNVAGSFYVFETRRQTGASEEVIEREEGDWRGGAIVDWASRLALDGRFDPVVERAARVSELVEAIYACAGGATRGGRRRSCGS